MSSTGQSLRERLEAMKRKKELEAQGSASGTHSTQALGAASAEVAGCGASQVAPTQPPSPALTIAAPPPATAAPPALALESSPPENTRQQPEAAATNTCAQPPSRAEPKPPQVEEPQSVDATRQATPTIGFPHRPSRGTSAGGDWHSPLPTYEAVVPVRRTTSFDLVRRFIDEGKSSASSSSSAMDTGSTDPPPAKQNRAEGQATAVLPTAPHSGCRPARVLLSGSAATPGSRGARTASDFDMGRKISEGVYGVVYRGVDRETKVPHALKWLKGKWFTESKAGFPEYLLREIDLLDRVDHPNVLRSVCMANIKCDPANKAPPSQAATENKYVAQGSQSTKMFVVTEDAGHNLRSEIYRDDEPLKLESVKWILQQLLDGLSFLHGWHILHRDLKPSNVLVDPNAHVKLCDLGLARFQRPGAASGRLTPTVITLMYRPPELHLGLRNYTAAVDMWSIGCIAAEMVLHRPLLPANEDLEHLRLLFNTFGVPSPDAGGPFPRYVDLPEAETKLAGLRLSASAASDDAVYTERVDSRTGRRWYDCSKLRALLREARPSTTTTTTTAGKEEGEEEEGDDASALIDLVQRLLQWNPADRLTAAEAREHRFFSSGCTASPEHILERRRAYEERMERMRAARQHRHTPAKGPAAPAAVATPLAAEPSAAANDATAASNESGSREDEEDDDRVLGRIAPAEVGVLHVDADDEDDEEVEVETN